MYDFTAFYNYLIIGGMFALYQTVILTKEFLDRINGKTIIEREIKHELKETVDLLSKVEEITSTRFALLCMYLGIAIFNLPKIITWPKCSLDNIRG